MKKYVWEFTNQRKLTKDEFVDYFERKIYRTIRKYGMLPSDKRIILAKEESKFLNAKILASVLEKRFSVEFSSKANFSSENLSDVAEDFFGKVLEGDFSGKLPKDSLSRPLYFLSDKEIELYAELKGIKGKKKKRDAKVQNLFGNFLKKNQDLEQNVVNALMQVVKR